MQKYVDGVYSEMTPDETAKIEAEQRKFKALEMAKPRTIDDGVLALGRALLCDKLAGSEDKTLAIACMAFFEPWRPGIYIAGDVRTNPETGYPRECILTHDGTVNPNWNIMTPSLWRPFHSRSAEYALPWERPTGAHDMYKDGEYMVWEDGNIYKCVTQTNFSPAEHAASWEIV